MKLTFREYDSGYKNEIAYNGKIIGHVERSCMGLKWKIVPYFKLRSTFFNQTDEKWDSFYLAGKALARLYESEINYKDVFDQVDTQPIDMRNVWNNYKTKP